MCTRVWFEPPTMETHSCDSLSVASLGFFLVISPPHHRHRPPHFSSALQPRTAGMPCCRFERLSLRASVRAFVAAHTFVYPGIFFLAVGLLAGLSVEATVVAVALYALTFNGAERTGSRRSIAFMRSFLECHAYFPVVTKMWDGTAYTSEPNEGHFRVFDVERKQFVFGLHPHGPIPLGASVLLPQLTRWERIVQRLRVGVASAVFWAPIIRDFYLGYDPRSEARRTKDGAAVEDAYESGHCTLGSGKRVCSLEGCDPILT